MRGIQVEVNHRAPDTFKVAVAQLSGGSYELPRDHEDVLEIEELAYGRLLGQSARSLPAGAIRVLISEGLPGDRPTNQQVADQVARSLAEQTGGWSAWL
jgi:hypothetical protein